MAEMPRFLARCQSVTHHLRLLAALAAVLATTGWTGGARAQPAPPANGPAAPGDAAARARDHAGKGRRLYDLRHYDQAIREFEQAYQLDNDPAHLYNIAQSHRLANHVPEAIAAYRAYLDRLPDAPNRPDVERRIAELSASQRPPNGLDPQPHPAAPPPAAVAPGSWPPPQIAPPATPGTAPLVGDPGAAPAGYPPPGPYHPGAPALGQTVTPPGHHSHDGFFLRMQLGLGYTSVSAENADLKISGSSGHFLMAAGVALAGKLVLYGEFGAGTITEPSVTVNNQSGSFDGELTVYTFGVGAAFYIMPANVYLSATLGGSQVELEVRNGLDVHKLESKTGFGITLSAGKEWWVSKDLGLGVALQLHGSAVKEDIPVEPDTLTPGWVSVAFSGTYN
jgi:tetratricopeptide (TPR) repeat protein